MNHLVFLDAQASELEKVLSGVKTMVLKEFERAGATDPPVSPGDSLFFLKNKGDCALRVKSTAVRVLPFTGNSYEDLSHTLKEMQPRLQLTEDQYNYWSTKRQVVLVEFDSAHKIDVIRVASKKIADKSNWIAFEELSLITE